MATPINNIPYKYFVNGQILYDMGPQVPYGATQISPDEFLQGSRQLVEQFTPYAQKGDSWSQKFIAEQQNYQNQLQNGLSSSGYVTLSPEEQQKYGFSSNFVLGSELERAKQQEADVASGKLVPIGTAPNGQLLYAPSGSAAVKQAQDPNQAQYQGSATQTTQPRELAPLGSTERTNQLLGEASQQTGVAAPIFQTNQAPQTSQTTGTPQGTQVRQSSTPVANAYGLTGEYAQMYTLLQGYLEKLNANGQSINPNVEITPERVSEFMKQAQSNVDAFLPYASKEIKPFFENQLKIAREGFLRGMGYSQQQLLQHEADLERKFTESQRGIGEQAAEQGFAQSGLRFRQERENVDATQRALNQGRQQAGQQATNLATNFAQQFGTANTPSFNIQGTPQVGDTGFNNSQAENPYYQLSPETYAGLKGEQEFAQESATRTRAAQLEEAFRGSLATNQQRNLTI